MPHIRAGQDVCVGAAVRVKTGDGRWRRALVECAGDEPGSWDVCYEDDGSEEDGVAVARLAIAAVVSERQRAWDFHTHRTWNHGTFTMLGTSNAADAGG